jgi:glutathione S-transferase
MSQPKVTYFDIRARAEPIRLVLEEMAIPYEDHRVAPHEWPVVKFNTPFGWLPVYRDSDLEIWQSHAIYRHLARVHDLYGANEKDRVRCDVVEETFADLNTLIGKAPWRPDFEEVRTEFIERELSPALDRLERYLGTNEEGPSFWVGNDITFVDLIALAHLDCTGSIFPEVMPSHPHLQAFCDGIAQRPRIAAYLRSNRRPKGIQYGPDGRIDAWTLEGWRAPVD